jgi:hypothetical protein
MAAIVDLTNGRGSILCCLIIFVPNQNCSTFQIASGTTEFVENFNFKIIFLSEAFFQDSQLSHGEIRPWPKRPKRFCLGLHLEQLNWWKNLKSFF